MRSVLAALLLLVPISIPAQTTQPLCKALQPRGAPPAVSGASIGNIELNTNEKTAIIQVFNKSAKDITGFVLAIDQALKR